MHRLLLVIEQGGGENRTRDDAYVSAENFDVNMVIILAALLCALICALGLNSIVRCVLRCRRSFSLRAEAPSAAVGLKRRELRRIPVAEYGSGGANIAATECAICLGEFADGERVRILPKCNHGFHMECIDKWLVSHSSCPNCRHSLVDHNGAGPEVGNVGSGWSENEPGRQESRVVLIVEEHRIG